MARALLVATAVLALLLGAWGLGLSGVVPRGVALGLAGLIISAALVVGFGTGRLDRDLNRRVARLGVPVILAMVSQNAVNIVDTMFVGMLPAEVGLPGVAALGVSLPVFWLVGGFLSAIGVGTQALTARRFGEGDHAGAGGMLMSAAPLAAVLGIGVSIASYFVLPSILPFFNDNPAVVEQGIAFAQVRFFGIASMVITAAYKAFFDGTGQTRVHMFAAIVMNVINVVLCWGLILGNMGMPRLEVAGAAWASTLSSAVGTLVMIGWSLWPSVRQRFGLYSGRGFAWSTARRIVVLALPAGGATVVAMGGFLMFIKAVAAVDASSGTGIPVNASITTVIIQIVLLLFLVSFAYATATSSLLSQAMGDRKPDLAQRYAFESAKVGALVMGAIAGLMILYPEASLSVFLQSAKGLDESGKHLAIAAGVRPLQLVAATTLALTPGVVFMQALYGAGNTRFVFVVELVLHVGCLAPLAWVLGVELGGGLVGCWAAAALYIVLLGLAMGIKFARGSWKQIQL